jgi:carboxypeptidase PM20D1
MMERAILVALATVIVLVFVLGVRTLRVTSHQVTPATEKIDVGPGSLAVEHLAHAVRFSTVTPTVSTMPDALTRLQDFQTYLTSTYPAVFSKLLLIRANHGDSNLSVHPAFTSLLIEWKGTNPTLDPILLLAHQDVVPVEPGTEGDWEAPAFSGRVAGGYLWGRGTMDDKGSLISILEAAESLLESGFQPERTVYFGFGDDEETFGQGAQGIRRVLLERNVKRLAFVIDEGMAVTQGYMPGFKRPVALIGIAEKGSALIELTSNAKGGHASMPPRPTATGLLAQAVTRLETHPMPATLEGPTRRMLEFLAPEAPFPLRTVFANLWLFSPIIKANLARKPATDATMRTTAAVVRLESGVSVNVVPSQARAVVSFRIRPGDTVAGVMRYVQGTVDTSRIHVKLLADSREPTPVSDPESATFRVVAGAIRQVFPDAVVAPALVLGGTDSRHFTGIADAVYRFLPLWFRPGDDARIHGTNERVAVENVTEMVRFYRALIQAASRPF